MERPIGQGTNPKISQKEIVYFTHMVILVQFVKNHCNCASDLCTFLCISCCALGNVKLQNLHVCKMIFGPLLGIYPVRLSVSLSRGQLSIPKGIWWHLKTQLLVATPPARWGYAKDPANLLMCTRCLPSSKNNLVQCVSSAQVRKPCYRYLNPNAEG